MRNHRQTEAYSARLREGWLKRKAKGLGIAWNKGIKGLHLSPSTEFKPGHQMKPSTIAMMRARTGPMSGNWKGGITPANLLLRTTQQYKDWRTAVFVRDNFTCQECGVRGGDLQADHIKPFSTYPDLRFSLENGRTLCVDCHRQTPTYGTRNIPQLVTA